MRTIVAFLALTLATAIHAETITVHRDDFGIPHIFAETEAGCAYAMGYVQAEDRLVSVLENYLRAEGRMAEVYGESHYEADLKARMFRHFAKSKEHHDKKSVKIRAITKAYIAGLQAYMNEHPEDVPAWAPEVTPYHIAAVGRLLIWGWPEGEAANDLRRAEIDYAPDDTYRGSNQWLITPDRTATGAPIALIDPHLSWYGLFRFYEARYYGGDLAYSGMALPGLPLSTLGHSAYCSVAMTTGGPDTADVFYYTVNPENELQYRYNGEWRDMQTIDERIGVKQDDGTIDYRDVTFHYTHTGPVVARSDGKAYAMAFPYWDEIYHIDQVYAMNTAKNIGDMLNAFDMRQYMAQNIMVGTVDGDIFYLRNGRVPVRAEGVDPTLPINGEDPKNEWRGIHAIKDLVQILNPPAGYMQNNNVTPYRMMMDSPLVPEKYPAYIYGAGKEPAHQRAAMTLEHLHNDDDVTIEEAFEIASSTQVYGAGAWKDRLKKAMFRVTLPQASQELANRILEWDEYANADSKGATAYFYWKRAIWEDAMGDDEKRADRFGQTPPDSITDADLINALAKAAERMHSIHNSLDVPYGDVFRVGRRNVDGDYARTFPVAGGNPGFGMATPRNIGFDKVKEGLYVGQSGQTSTQIVLLTKPPKSWTWLPLGESDDPDSPHYDDQAAKLFSTKRFKSTYFMDTKALEEHTTKTFRLEYDF